MQPSQDRGKTWVKVRDIFDLQISVFSGSWKAAILSLLSLSALPKLIQSLEVIATPNPWLLFYRSKLAS